MLSPYQIDELCETLGFSHWPRAIGNPRQQFVHATEQVYKYFKNWWGDKSCFISTGGYDNIVFDNGKHLPKTINYALTFFDFDHDTKPENAFADAQRLSQFLTEIDVCHWVQYSGAKGYHLFIIHKPTRFKFDYRDGSGEALKTLVNQTQTHLKTTLGLNTLDEQTTGDPKRLCRFPFSPHVDRFGKTSGRHAMPVEMDILHNRSHFDIENLSYRPKYSIPKLQGDRLTLRELITRLDVKLHKPETELRPIIDVDFDFNDPSDEAAVFTAALEHRCMGVVNELKRRNPSHSSRVYSALYAKTLGMSVEEFESIWVELGTKMGYVDLHNKEHRLYQMATLFNDPKYVSFPNCSTLKRRGCCVGEICPRYVEMFEAVPERIIKRKWRNKNDN